MRDYTAAEIDDLRKAVRKKYRIGFTYMKGSNFEGWVGRGRSYGLNGYRCPDAVAAEAVADAADHAMAEEYVRTHMLAGHTAADLRP